MLDDHAGGIFGGEVADARKRRLGVEVVVVGHLLAVVLLGAADAHARGLGQGIVGVHSRGLVGVLAVPQSLAERHGHAELGRGLTLADLAPEVLGNHRVVRRAVLVRLPRQLLAELEVVLGGGLGLDVIDEGSVVGGVNEHVHERVVLGGGSNHGGAADVDVLDALREVSASRDGLAERVEVDGDDVDVADVVLLDGVDVGLEVAAREDTSVHRGVEGLDPAVEHLGEAGDLIDAGDLDAHVRDGLGASAGGDDFVPERVEALGELGHAGLVGDGDERAGLGAVGGLGLGTLAHIASDVLLACRFGRWEIRSAIRSAAVLPSRISRVEGSRAVPVVPRSAHRGVRTRNPTEGSN